jgi:hypothetical protein
VASPCEVGEGCPGVDLSSTTVSGMDIDRQAPAIAAGEVQIAAPVDTVWQVISDVRNWPTWNSDIASMAVEGPVEPGTEFRWKFGSARLVSDLQVVDPPREIGWTGVSMGIHAVHVFRLESRDGGTNVRSEESFRGIIASLMKGYSRKVLQRGIDSILAALKTEAERRAATP